MYTALPRIDSKNNTYKVRTYRETETYEQDTIEVSLKFISLTSREGHKIEIQYFGDKDKCLEWITEWASKHTHEEVLSNLTDAFEEYQINTAE